MKTKPICILKVKPTKEYITPSFEFPGEIYISIEQSPWDLIYFSNGRWESREYSKQAMYEQQVPLLSPERRKIFFELKEKLTKYLNDAPNACDTCVYKNEYLLKGKCDNIYKQI